MKLIDRRIIQDKVVCLVLKRSGGVQFPTSPFFFVSLEIMSARKIGNE